jgi:RNA polymerase sigma factor (sigma-70 family)
MGSHPLQILVRHVRRIAGASEPDPIGDADLMARFAASRDESAFAEIVQRHGPLVWAICRTNLNAADADDAFQATFLVLARKAKSIRKPGSLACWLSGVARRTIQAVRARQSRRREITLADDLPARTSLSADAGDTRQALAEEIDRLADKYRLPLLLCYYQGLTNEEAARRLGWPHGTVCGRLARARELLRTRLSRRGITLSVAGLSTVSAAQPAELIAATLQACAASASKPTITTLAEVVMHAMWMSKVKITVGTCLVAAIVGTGTGWVLTPATAQDGKSNRVSLGPTSRQSPPARLIEITDKDAERLVAMIPELLKPSPLAEDKPSDDELMRLKKERYRSALREMGLRFQAFQAGTAGSLDSLFKNRIRLFDSEIALGNSTDDFVRAAQRSVQMSEAVYSVNLARFNAGQIAPQFLEESKFDLLDARIKLLELSRKPAVGR